MKTASLRNAFLALGALALLSGPLLTTPAQAQDAAGAGAEVTTPITLDLRQVPIQSALLALFKSAGIKNYNIDTQAQGFVNMSVSDMPFDAALRQLISSANPPLTVDTQGGLYHVYVKPTPPPVQIPRW